MAKRALLVGFGGFLPERVLTNDELAVKLNTSDEWITTRTGIKRRHIAGPDDTAASMATSAAEAALAYAGMSASEVDAVIVATSTPDQAFPATAVRVQAALGMKQGFAFDIAAACSGFVYALAMANSFIRSGQARNVLVIGSEVYSRIVDWSDRTTCVLFGDGAGAVLVSGTDAPGESGILSTHLHSDGAEGDLLYVDGAVGRPHMSGHLKMSGRDVFRHAVAKLSSSVDEALESEGLSYSDVAWLVPHQANIRIIEGVGKKLGLNPEQVVVTVDRHANTSAASIPLALNEAVRDGRIKKGELVLMEALGGGLTWGSALARM
ncbi:MULTISPECIES: beta-ketoacyl-ACP synthase III [Acetobacter]|uniref:Beta-ketoacyl-[acyl-carrier-protein] synthase III n=1 Tax=Acetobacter thailandicus TaxID=1502842 RepID=A0ABT3QAY0_9PROT|nr:MULTISPECIES: beta-ketoacyl-ACP synthase III [Acetobacter]MBS0959374.1 ketoacyl-ACP synthase III [Acetobacter thailandicus]MBS0980561.1 ketoacyl-ACP synthase III [Acetobacter thailandicus]MBS1003748.1 ketoacyl-ACP synthase III [Acetobacter thailandicus]MCX2562442.1 ketoacyl-ACP synthase III [Acetobacter thailandicus]NHN94508.1 beta-ketoacyl-ACP synthase III [Acetobacter thailandicus]